MWVRAWTALDITPTRQDGQSLHVDRVRLNGISPNDSLMILGAVVAKPFIQHLGLFAQRQFKRVVDGFEPVFPDEVVDAIVVLGAVGELMHERVVDAEVVEKGVVLRSGDGDRT